MFERFQQADNAPSRRHGGLGLGLAIARHLTESHGGTVSATSDGPGRGATFVVSLPVDETRRRPPRTTHARGDAPALLFTGTRILVADDEADARELTRVVLESRGAEVVTVTSAGEALFVLGRHTFDVVVADIGMPEQDGYALIKAIRLMPHGRGGRVPAVAVTAFASLEEREAALAAGFDWHLGKPVDPEQLVATIAQAIAGVAGSANT